MYFFGILNGLLPCGLVYMAVAASLVTGSVINAMLFMLFFGLGATPALLLAIVAAHRLPFAVKHRLGKFLPVFSVLVGLLLVLRGLNLDIPFISPYFNSAIQSSSVVECHTP